MALTPEQQKELNTLRKQERDLNIEMDRLTAKGEVASRAVVNLEREKLQLSEKVAKILGIQQTKMSKVADTMDEFTKSSVETVKTFQGLVGQMQELGKGNKFAVSQQKSYQALSKGIVNLNKSQIKNVTLIKNLEQAKGVQMNLLQGQVKEELLAQLDSANALDRIFGGQLAVYDQISDVAKEIAAQESARGDMIMESVSMDYTRQQAMAAQAQLAEEMQSLSGEDLAVAQQKMSALQKAVELIQQQTDLLDYQISQRDAMTDAVVAPFTNMKSVVESIPGIGTGLSKLMGLDVFATQMNDIVGKSIQVGMADGLDGGVAKFKELAGQTKIFGMTLKSALGPLLGAAAIIGAIALFKSLSEESLEISKNTGQTVAQAEKMNQQAKQLQASSGNNLSNTEDILAAQIALKEEFASTANFSGETALNIANMSTAFGIAVGDAAAVQRQFEAMGQTSEEAFNTQALTANLAEAAGVAPGKVMADIAKSSKAASKYLGGNSKALAKAAVEAAKLGMELSDMVGIADGLLDIESSIEAEFEASVMLGKQINMDLARQLALQGDIEGATKAVLDQVGSIHDFNNMDVLQRKKIAQAAGMEVGQLQNALQKQEQLNNLTAEQKVRYDEAAKALEGSTLSGEDLVAQQEAAAAAKEMGAQFDKIKNTLMKSLMPVVKAITEIFTSVLSPVLSVIGTTFKTIFFILKPVFALVKGIAKVFEFLSPLLIGIAGTMGLMYMYNNKNLMLEKASMALASGRKKIGQFIGMLKAREQATTVATGAAEQANLATQNLSTKARLQQVALDAKKMGMALKTAAIAAKDFLVAKGKLLLEKIGLGKLFTKAGVETGIAATKVTQLGTETAINAQKNTGLLASARELALQAAMVIKKGALFLWETLTNKEKLKGLGTMILQTGQYVIQQGILLAQQAINLAINAILAIRTALQAGGIAGLIGQAAAGIAAAVGPIFATFAAIPFGLGIPLAIAAIAGMVALFASMGSKKADDLVSGPSGGGGYGKRVLLAPEGTFSFNNKDTIVAGTKLNDAVIGGAAGSIGNGPVESEVTDLGKDAARKFMKIHMTAAMVASSPFGMLMGGLGAIGGGLSGLFGGEEEAEEGSAVYDETNATKMDEMLTKLDQLITAVASAGGGSGPQGPVQIVIGNKVIEEISGMMNVNKSYNILAGSAGEEA